MARFHTVGKISIGPFVYTAFAKRDLRICACDVMHIVTKVILLVHARTYRINYDRGRFFLTVMMAFNCRPMDIAIKTKFYNDNEGKKIKFFFSELSN